MTKFKKGDVVRVKDAWDLGDVKTGDVCVVSSISSPTSRGQWVMLEGKKNVIIDFSYPSDTLELVTFAPGQRVVLTQDNDLWGKKGDAGTVVSVGEEARVRFDKTVHGQREWLADVRRLDALVEEKWVPKVGDWVIVTNNITPCGDPIKMYEVGKEYKVTRVTMSPAGTPEVFLLDHFQYLRHDQFKPAPFTIEAGRYYKTRDGRKVGPMVKSTWGLGWFDGSKRITSQRWEADGSFIYGQVGNLDLVAIWPEEPVKVDNRADAGGGFKEGDRIRLVRNPCRSSKVGDVFTAVDRKGHGGLEVSVHYRDKDGRITWRPGEYFELVPPVSSTNLGAQVDTLSDEYGQGVTAASVTASKPKFKVGDRVRTNGWSRFYEVSKVSDAHIWVKVPGFEDGKEVIGDREFTFDHAVTTTSTAIVCLIEDDQPKPATRPYVHGTKESAATEAKRLASVHKGQEFGVYVLADTAKEEAVKEEKVYEHEWQRLAMEGRKIDAIKELRRITGLGLKPTKDAVEYWLAAA